MTSNIQIPNEAESLAETAAKLDRLIAAFHAWQPVPGDGAAGLRDAVREAFPIAAADDSEGGAP